MLTLTDSLEWWARRFQRPPAPATAPVAAAPERPRSARALSADRDPREPDRSGSARVTGRFARRALQER